LRRPISISASAHSATGSDEPWAVSTTRARVGRLGVDAIRESIALQAESGRRVENGRVDM
jgi:hypothetical protein